MNTEAMLAITWLKEEARKACAGCHGETDPEHSCSGCDQICRCPEIIAFGRRAIARALREVAGSDPPGEAVTRGRYGNAASKSGADEIEKGKETA